MTAGEHKRRELEFHDHHFEMLRAQAKKYAGINLTAAKKELVYSRLVRRLRRLGLEGFTDYCRLLKTRPEQELMHFINAITTNKTGFFREPHHFEFLTRTAIPQLINSRDLDRKIRIWSAGCSTGQEPYSIAIVLLETVPYPDIWDIRILATDIDSDVLENARQGIYKTDELIGLSPARLKRWFKKGTGQNEGKVRIDPELSQLISFKRLNLMDDWPLHGPFDLLFCRNTVIYFDKSAQKRLFERFSGVLAGNGYLFIGHSESLFSISNDFQHLGQTIHKKVA